jgi:hypothetical protein
MYKNVILYGLLYAISITLISCEKSDDQEDQDSDLVKISSVISVDQSFKVDLYARDTLFEGYNKLFLSITNQETKQPLSEAELKLKPMMDMITMKHSAPFENPAGVVNTEGYFEGAVVFIMPSTGDMGWTLEVNIKTVDTEGTATLIIPVVRSLEEARKINVISAIDECKYFVSILEPVEPKVGINTCEFTIHYKESMMSFPPAKDITMEIEPEMPSMDHGSPNNEHPAHIGEGHYVGKLNFTMTGWWRVHITLKKGDEIITDDAFMDITLQ